MKKEEKIIKIRTAAKMKLANLKAEMMTAKSEAAQTHADIMAGRTDKCDNERFNEIERFKAEKMAIEADFYNKKAALYAETETACQEAVDDDDPEPEQEPKPEHDKPQQTVYCDGSELSARIVARRLINKMPRVPRGGSLSVCILRQENGEFFVWVTEIGENTDTYIATTFSKFDDEKKEADFVERARRMFVGEQESGNSHVAEPMAHALDAVFGGNPVEQVENLIADTVKSGKEGENE